MRFIGFALAALLCSATAGCSNGSPGSVAEPVGLCEYAADVLMDRSAPVPADVPPPGCRLDDGISDALLVGIVPVDRAFAERQALNSGLALPSVGHFEAAVGGGEYVVVVEECFVYVILSRLAAPSVEMQTEFLDGLVAAIEDRAVLCLVEGSM